MAVCVPLDVTTTAASGQTWRHVSQRVHFSSSTCVGDRASSESHRPGSAGRRACSRCSRRSPGTRSGPCTCRPGSGRPGALRTRRGSNLSVESTGLGAVLPSPQRLPGRPSATSCSSSSRSPRRAAARADAIQDVEHPPRADAAERALAARLVLREAEEVAGDVDHAVRVVQHDQAAGAHDRADLGQGLVVDGRVGQLGGHAAAGGPPICTALKRRPPATPPPISSTIWRIVMPIGTSISPPRTDLAGQGEDLRALALLGAQRRRPPRRGGRSRAPGRRSRRC